MQEMIEQHVNWNDDIGEWQLRCVAYTGNNMRKQTPQPEKDKDKVGVQNVVSVSLVPTGHNAENHNSLRLARAMR